MKGKRFKKEAYRRKIYITLGLGVLIFFTILICQFYSSLQERLFEEQKTHFKENAEDSILAFDTMIKNSRSCQNFFAEILEHTYPDEENDIFSILQKENETLGQDGEEFLVITSDGFYYSADSREGRWQDDSCLTSEEKQPVICTLTLRGKRTEAMIFEKKLPTPVTIGTITVTHILLLKDPALFWNDLFWLERLEGSFGCMVGEDGQKIYQKDGRKETEAEENSYYTVYARSKESTWTLLFFVPSSAVEQAEGDYRKLLLHYFLLVFVMLVFVISGSVVSFFQAQDSRRMMKQKEGANRLLSSAVLEADAENEAKRSFLSHISHDIRTPINGIMGMTEIAMKNLSHTEKMKDCLKKISGSSRHLLSLVNDVLDMSRIESGKTVLNYEKVNLIELLEHCCSILGSQIFKKNIILNKEIEQLPHPYAIGDELHLQQIFINILGNAVKFTPEGGTIWLRADEIKSNEKKMILCFEISDNGPGMDKDFLETIFEPYSQEKNAAGTEEGTGLGMTITKHFVDLMGGTIEVKSERMKGSSFFVTIPFEIASAPEQAEDKERNVDLNKKSLLLVEDNELNLEIARDMLAEAGSSVTVAKNGKEAVEIFLQSEPGEFDLILMDIIMPVMDGLEAARRIRSSNHPSAESIPILAMTANAYSEDVEKSKAAGMNAHLSKPFAMEELLRQISRLWENKG